MSAAALAPVRVEPARVEFSGCARVRSGPVCEAEAGSELSVWLPRSFEGTRVLIGGQPVSAAERVAADGYRIVVKAPARSSELFVEEPGRAPFRLALVPPFRSAALEAAEHAKESGDYARALELLAPLQRKEDAPLERLLADGIAARALLRQGQAERASELLAQTAPALFSAGQISDATRDVFARLFILIHRLHRLDEAQRWFDRFREPVRVYPFGRALEREHEGMLLARLGRASGALGAYASAERLYERLGQGLDARRVQENRIGLWSDLGQVREAHAAHTRLLPPPEAEHPCGKADLYIKQSWLAFLLLEQGELDNPAEVARALADVEPWLKACGDPTLRVMHQVNVGLFALQREDAVAARAIEQSLAALPAQSPELEAWVLDLRGRLALERGQRSSAKRHFQSELEIAELTGSLDARLRALSGLAEIARAAGQSAEAKQKLAEALSSLERAQRLAPLGALGHSYHAARRSAAQRLVELSIADGEIRAAFTAALSAYRAASSSHALGHDVAPENAERVAQVLSEYRRRRAELDAEILEDWQHTAPERKVRLAARAGALAELSRLLDEASRALLGDAALHEQPAPEPGEYWLLTFPVTEGWALFGTDGAEIAHAHWRDEARRSSDEQPPSVTPRTEPSSVTPATEPSSVTPATEPPGVMPRATDPRLRAFESQLSKARSISILAAGASRNWPFESFSLQGEPLAWRPLRFSAALGRRGARSRAPRPSRAAVIFDATRDLPFARREGALVQRALGIGADQMLEGERATPHAVLSLFERSERVHFAGHAQSPDEAGGAALLLARGARLQAWEFYALSRAPSEVILSACNSGLSNRESLGPGWSLAQALLAAGAEAVLAPIGDLADGDAYELQERLYAELSRGTPLAQAFALVQRSRAPGAKGALFRLFTR